MNKKAWYTFRIVLGGYLAWLGIRMLIEMVNEKPNNMVFMCVMSVIFILIGLAYAIYYVKKMFDLKKEDHRIEEEDKEAFDAGKDQADRKRRKNVLPEIGPNEEMKKEAEQGKTDKETAQSGNNIEKEAEKLDRKAYLEMQVADYILNNNDRHEQNWGFLMENTSGKLVGYCPLFDHDHTFGDDRNVMSQTTDEIVSLYDSAVLAQKELRIDFSGLEGMQKPELLSEKQWEGVLERAEELRRL